MYFIEGTIDILYQDKFSFFTSKMSASDFVPRLNLI